MIRTKMLLCLLGILLIYNSKSKAQVISSDASIVFVGIDFTHLKLVGTLEDWNEDRPLNTEELVTKSFPTWNYFFVNEPNKYNVNYFFRSKKIENQISFFNTINNQVNPNNLLIDNSIEVTPNEVQNWVSRYDFKNTTSDFILFLVAIEFNKKKSNGSYYWVLYDKANDKFHLSNLQTAKAGGIKFTNYWARTFLNVLEKGYVNNRAWFEG